MSFRKWHAVTACLVMSLLAATARAETVTVSASINLKDSGPRIESDLYGQFIENLGTQIYDGIWVGPDSPIPNINGFRKDTVEALKKLEIPVLRWGGCFADQYDWRDGIGPREARPVRHVTLYGGTTETNAFGTHEFFDFAEMLGAEPYLNINMGSLGPLDGARWIEYVTSNENTALADERRRNGRDQSWKLKYIGIGNETWGCGGEMDAEYTVDLSRRYANFLDGPPNAPVLKIISGPSGNQSGYVDYLDKMMEGNRLVGNYGLLFHAVSLHYYTGLGFANDGGPQQPPPALGFNEDGWAGFLFQAVQMETFLSSISAVMDKHDPDNEIALSVDEWGSWHSAVPGSNPYHLHQQSSLLDATVAALTLNILHRHTDRVKLANNSEMVNAIDALILTEGEKFLLTPVYHIYDMYKPFKGATPYKVSVQAPPYDFGDVSLPMVDISAAKSSDSKVYVALVNLDPNREAKVETDLRGSAQGRILTAETLDAHNTFEAPHAVEPASFRAGSEGIPLSVSLPPKSIAVLSMDAPQ